MVTTLLGKRDSDIGNGTGLEREPLCRQFRQLRYEETTGPREALRRLHELCRLWLRPETHSKEQMLELLVLEQFLRILPTGLRARVRERRPQSGEEAVVVLEDLHPELRETGQQVGKVRCVLFFKKAGLETRWRGRRKGAE